ncbi:hypothetical protein 3S11_8 [uncultured Caudovirales phage]|uniref:HK97 gp10 family phage protein n=1 Tax=uncultured Caudovirales phage TaxID=2100421 RepID=A0A2H4J887_9CAUD|nr:HK97 gp10 family phage protein [Pseudomonas luteola]ASN68686.1 hypothetical protein 3S11_8 [uncultured Caudovirales phage]QEU28914.1 HK97 gp10 family phage protein [Pseudomonas luteola]
MSSNTFSLAIREWAEKAGEALDDTCRAIVIEVGSSLVRMSPVDSGRFRGNWQFNIDKPASGVLETQDPDGNETIQKLVAEANTFSAGQVAYIINNLPYGPLLEFGGYNGPTEKVNERGFSRKAPEGFVRITQARFQKIVREAAAEHRV